MYKSLSDLIKALKKYQNTFSSCYQISTDALVGISLLHFLTVCIKVVSATGERQG